MESEIEPYFARAGTVIEKSLLEYSKRELNKHFVSYDPKKIGYDLFHDVEIFGGIPDGEEVVGNSVQSILEIKTTPLDKYCYTIEENELRLVKDQQGFPVVKEYRGNLNKWFGFSNTKLKIPEEYQYQLALYLYLRGIEKGYFCVAFLNKEHYLSPESYVPQPKSRIGKESPHLVVIEEMNINLEKFSKCVETARSWYKKYIMGGISPTLTPQDLNWIRFGFPAL
ncbi:putative YqaJ family viral recombinase [Candidatus Mycoplasma haematolamae str. Purdue]|uniref:Putative YqaJ family viral recombinase n=1 Tax=Mycoplasma haematolamae (strain Purdue) TaxID=1212765 RepID=I7CIK3_MYCHA|nr:putative YqaJ family viral recombinase [Candidatus Mycoplasma haematolamae str. Purdue]